MITLTPVAGNKLKELIADEAEPGSGLRVKVIPGGCSGFEYAMTFDMPADGDEVVEQHGVKVIIDRMSGRSKGFGFVEMSSDEEAQKAIDSLDGQEIDGRSVKVNEAKPQTNRGGGGGRGGYGGGGGGGRGGYGGGGGGGRRY